MAKDKTKEATPAPRIVEAVGLATARPGLGLAIEAAMGAAIGELEAEAKKIWEDEGIAEVEKNRLIAELMSPKSQIARKMAARKRVKDAARAQDAIDAAAATAALDPPDPGARVQKDD